MTRPGISKSSPMMMNKLDRRVSSKGMHTQRRPRILIAFTALGVLAALVSGSTLILYHALDDEQKIVHASYTSHAPIIIYRDADFNATNGVVSGSGTASDPFIIDGWDISTENIGACMFVFSTSVYYVISNCHLHLADAVCLELERAPHGTVKDCLIDEGSYGIFVTQSPDVNITGNTVTNMGNVSIFVGSSQWANVTDNVVTNNVKNGILSSRQSNLTIANNTVTGNGRSGLYIANATDLLIVGNNASNNGMDGVRIEYCTNTTIVGNNVTSNVGTGLRFDNSTGALVYHNRFIGNGMQAFDETSGQVKWNASYPTGGNYWSDYAGLDIYSGPEQDQEGSDGIGDSPYALPGSAADMYPFVTEELLFVPEFSTIILPLVGIATGVAVICRKRRQ